MTTARELVVKFNVDEGDVGLNKVLKLKEETDNLANAFKKAVSEGKELKIPTAGVGGQAALSPEVAQILREYQRITERFMGQSRETLAKGTVGDVIKGIKAQDINQLLNQLQIQNPDLAKLAKQEIESAISKLERFAGGQMEKPLRDLNENAQKTALLLKEIADNMWRVRKGAKGQMSATALEKLIRSTVEELRGQKGLAQQKEVVELIRGERETISGYTEQDLITALIARGGMAFKGLEGKEPEDFIEAFQRQFEQIERSKEGKRKFRYTDYGFVDITEEGETLTAVEPHRKGKPEEYAERRFMELGTLKEQFKKIVLDVIGYGAAPSEQEVTDAINAAKAKIRTAKAKALEEGLITEEEAEQVPELEFNYTRLLNKQVSDMKTFLEEHIERPDITQYPGYRPPVEPSGVVPPTAPPSPGVTPTVTGAPVTPGVVNYTFSPGSIVIGPVTNFGPFDVNKIAGEFNRSLKKFLETRGRG